MSQCHWVSISRDSMCSVVARHHMPRSRSRPSEQESCCSHAEESGIYREGTWALSPGCAEDAPGASAPHGLSGLLGVLSPGGPHTEFVCFSGLCGTTGPKGVNRASGLSAGDTDFSLQAALLQA